MDRKPILQPAPRAGFSLVELILVVAILGIIAGVVVTSVSGSKEAATAQKAIAQAEALNLAMVRFRMENPTASATWASAGSDDARYALLQPYLPYAPASLAAFNAQADPYSFSFGSLDQKVTIIPAVAGYP